MLERAAKQLYFGQFYDCKQPELPSAYEVLELLNGQHRLAAWHLPARTPAPRAVILLTHPMTKAGKHFFVKRGYPERLAAAGYHVVGMDFNGFGESDQIGLNYKADVRAAMHLIRRRWPELPVGAWGLSLGAGSLLTYTTLPDHGLRAVVLENSIASNVEFFKVLDRKKFLLLWTINKLLPAKNQDKIYRDRVREMHSVAALFIHGEQDPYAPVHLGEYFVQATPVPAELATFDSGHLENADRIGEPYFERVVSFLDQHFNPRP